MDPNVYDRACVICGQSSMEKLCDDDKCWDIWRNSAEGKESLERQERNAKRFKRERQLQEDTKNLLISLGVTEDIATKTTRDYFWDIYTRRGTIERDADTRTAKDIAELLVKQSA